MQKKINDVFIIGIGEAPVLKETSLTLGSLGALAIKEAMDDAHITKIEALYVGNMLSGILSHQQQLGSLVASAAGLTGIEAMTVEAACCSGAGALHLGVLAIASGIYDCVAVCGLELMSKTSRVELSSGLATASDWEKEGAHGDSFITLNARMMKDYIDHYHIAKSDLANFAINAHKNAFTNPHALLHKEITQSDYENARILEGPICLFDACPVCDGAATVILASKSFVELLSNTPLRIRIRASTVSTDTLGLNTRHSLHALEAVRHSSQLAYEQAGISPQDIDLFELHDAYSIIAILSLEESGFAKPGRGFELALNNEIGIHGKIPISTFGGLKARGHPVGATGIYQTVEVVKQLSNRGGANQVPGAVIGMTQNIGGVGGTVITHILEAA